SSVSVNAPASGTVDTPFDVTVAAALHNNGPTTSVNADTILSLTVPADCTPTPTSQTVQNTNLASSTSTNVQSTWSVSCSNPSFHQFDGSATVSVDQLHVTDTTPANDSGNASDTTAVSATADLKVTAVTLTLPGTIAAGVDFPATVDVTVHNNGIFTPVGADVDVDLSATPAGCTFTPSITQSQAVTLATSTSVPVSKNWTVNCSAASYTFTGTGTITTNELHVIDPDSTNDTVSVDEQPNVNGGDATLTVTKVVINDDGGTAVVPDFTLRIDGTPVTSGSANTVSAGTHTVSEDSFSGYSGAISCDNGAFTSTTSLAVTLSQGETVTCTITNDDIQPGGGTPNPVGGIVGLLDAPDGAARSEAQSGNSVAIVLVLAAGAAILIAVASVWVSRSVRRP
ncbi:MAG: hypothetical protein ACE5FA_04985, partial [Dehalococcoidia bacterium]